MSDDVAEAPEKEPDSEEQSSATGTRGFRGAGLVSPRSTLPPGSALSLLWWRERDERS